MLWKIWRFCIHYKRAFVFFFVSAWEKIVANSSWNGIREFLSIVGVFLGLVAGVALTGLLILCAAILSGKSFHFKYDFTWKAYGEAMANTMLSIALGTVLLLFFVAIIQPIYLHWVDAWKFTSSRARAIRLMQ